MSGKYQSFIGLEIHIQLTTETKVFCSCKNRFGDEPNTNVCPVCMGYPGTLPALNQEAIRKSYAVAKALNCQLAPTCAFDRKNYFYPDLPKNYQISQFGAPLGTNGWIEIPYESGKKRIRIKEAHLEEDAGKMIHAGDMSLLDYNRTGTPLLEIVTEPDLVVGEEAEILLQELRRLVRYMGVCDGNMEEGSMRCDANVSINLAGKGLGRKVEVKNLNSSRFVRKAIAHEIVRQAEVLDSNSTVKQETRLWNENRDQTEPMRSKESANDYRYFPEPDMPPFKADEIFLKSVEVLLVEAPMIRRERLEKTFGITEAQAELICDEKPIADYFERLVSLGADPLMAATWMGSDVKKELNRTGKEIHESPLTATRFAYLLDALAKGRINGKIAKQVLEIIFEEDKEPEQIIKEKSLERMSDPVAVAAAIDQILTANPKAVAEVKAGDQKPIGFLVGQVMRATGGRADPQLLQQVLNEKLGIK